MTLKNRSKDTFDKFLVDENEINIKDILSPDDIASLIDIFGEDVANILQEKQEQVQEEKEEEQKQEEEQEKLLEQEFLSHFEEFPEKVEKEKIKGIFGEVVKSAITCFIDKTSKITNTIISANLQSIAKYSVFQDFNLMMIKGNVRYDDIKNTENDIFLLFDENMIPDIIDLMFSGSIRKSYDKDLIKHLKYSNIEKDLLKYFFGNFCDCLNENLTKYFSKSSYKVEGIFNNSNDLIAYSLENPLVRAKIELKIEDKRDYIYLYIPERFISTSNLIANGYLHKEEKWKELVERKLSKTKVIVEAKVLYEDIPLRKLLNLKKGDIFYITEENLYLFVNDKAVHNVNLGIVDNGILAVSLKSEEENTQETENIQSNNLNPDQVPVG